MANKTQPSGTLVCPRIAAISTSYYFRSHSDNFITRFLEGHWIGPVFHPPSCEIVSIYVDQIRQTDISQRLAMAYGVRTCSSITEALTLGGSELQVDGVLLIVEHGDYPRNERAQKLYPRFEFMREVVAVFRKSRRSVPVFLDKHLSHDWSEARQIVDWSRELRFPLIAGSSLPVTWREPRVEFPLGTGFEEILVVGGGWFGETWFIHLLETLQCFAERRRGGETGIRSVQSLVNVEVWRAALAGRWDRALLDAALACRRIEGAPGVPEEVARRAAACLIHYNDGLKAVMLTLGGGLLFEYLAAFRLKGRDDTPAVAFCLPAESADNVSPLVRSITRMFHSGVADRPIERTLLTTGALAAAMESGHKGQTVRETPHLNISYQAKEVSDFTLGGAV